MHDQEYIIGDPGSQMHDWIMQDSDNCAVAAETSILHHFLGDDAPSLDEASYISASNGWYHPGNGTPTEDVGNLLEMYNIPVHSVNGASVDQLASELQAGHGVIVGVDSSELWDHGMLAELRDFLIDAFGLNHADFMHADHAITVTGMDVSNPDHPMVLINDSGAPDGAAARYPLDEFANAWSGSGFHYTATDIPLSALHSPDASGFDVGAFLGLGTTVLTGDANAGALVTMTTDAILQTDWDAILHSI